MAVKRFHLSARGFHRILKVSRTIADPSAALRADLAGSEAIASVHRSAGLTAGVAEVLQYRARGLR